LGSLAEETLALVREKMGLDHYRRLLAEPTGDRNPSRVMSGLAFVKYLIAE
jgi:hypothetical protein